MDDAALRGVCLDRTVELGAVRLRVLDWPGRRGSLVVLPDPCAPSSELARCVAEAFAPAYRVVLIDPRVDVPYQAAVNDVHAVLAQFGFLNAVLVSSGHGAALVLPLAAWWPEHVSTVVLLEPRYDPPAAESAFGRSLRDAPPQWSSLAQAAHVVVTTQRELTGALAKLL